MADHGKLAYEFPDFSRSDVPAFTIGMEDNHWHNDACPCWSMPLGNGARIYVYVDFLDVAQRETPASQRFSVFRGTDTDMGECILATDSEADVIAAKWAARFGLGFHPDTRGADYVTPNGQRCLSDAEAAEYDVDIDRLCGLGDPYEHGIAAWRALGLIE